MRQMKDSGIEWIGQIPQKWDVCKFKNAVDIYNGNSIKDEEKANYDDPIDAIPYVATKDLDVTFQTIDYDNGMYVKNSDVSFKRAPKGSTLLCIEGGSAGKKIAFTTQDVCFINKLCCFHSKMVVNKYIYYFMQSPAFREEFRLNISGLIGGVSINELKDFPIILPAQSEQVRIVNFLDAKCAEIDELIAAKENTNALLRERRQSIIYEAVTKGLNPDVPMKDSDIEWIGMIPKDWVVGKTIYGLEMPITDGPHETPQLYSEGVPFISAEAVSCGNGNIDFNHIRGYISEEYYAECCKKYIPRINDIYMIKSGATTGKVAIVDTDRKFTIWSPLAVFRCAEHKCHYKYLYYFLQSDAYQKQVEASWSFGTQQNIGMRTLERLLICFPGVNEQKEIADYLDARCSETDLMIAANEATIQKLKEYRQSIIYEAVTGKIEI